MHVTKSTAAGTVEQPEEIDAYAETPEYVKRLSQLAVIKSYFERYNTIKKSFSTCLQAEAWDIVQSVQERRRHIWYPRSVCDSTEARSGAEPHQRTSHRSGAEIADAWALEAFGYPLVWSPPNPGSTVITKTKSIVSKTGSNSSIFV